jgi:hypothetical protein
MMPESKVALPRRRSWGIVLLACMAMLGPLWLAAPSLAVNEPLVFVKNLALWSADSDGTNQQLLTGVGVPENDVSTADLDPRGNTAVYADRVKRLYLINVITHARTLVYTGGTYPKFSPDGKKIIFALNNEDIASINTDGTGFTTAIAWRGKQDTPDYSPDGTKIVFSSATDSKGKSLGGNQVFIANANGSSPVQLTKNTGTNEYPTFSPSGTTIAFTLFTTSAKRIYTISTSGTNQTQITTGDGGDSDWSPDGSYLIFGTSRDKPNNYNLYKVSATGGPETPLITDPVYSVDAGWMRHPSTTIGFFDFLATRFEPVLRFDNSEKWRPLNVESFFAESQHQICDNGTCDTAPIKTAADLNRHRTSSSYINVAGSWTFVGDEASYHSPYAECTVNELRDCDTGARSAIYYRSGGIYGGYEYVDYWYFYRANYFYEAQDFHEGDWEGVTIAPSLTQNTFDYAAFSQHGPYYSYLRDVLRCEDVPAVSLPGRGTCGTEASHVGHRVDDLVANGSHANYTTSCHEDVILVTCQQNGPGKTERGYDGTKRWGRTFDEPTSSLLPMPATGSTNWTDWPGKWGSPAQGPFQKDGPASPANQSVKIECATIDNEPGCTTGPRMSRRGPAQHAYRSPGLAALSCSSWVGQGIVAATCDPKQLRQAVRAGRVGSGGGMAVSVVGAAGTSASGHGVAQYLSASVLHDGSRLRFSGRAAKGTEVLVRTLDATRQHTLLARFPLALPGFAKGATAARTKNLRLSLRVAASRSGRPEVSLGGIQARAVRAIDQ